MENIFEALKASLASGTGASYLGAPVLCYFGGILSSFTPCIYPMIPITVGFVGGASEQSVRNGLALSSLYVLGMSLVYTVLGIFASLTGRIFGAMTNSTGWYLALGFIMVVSALWMMDVIEFDPNVWISRFMSRKTRGARHAPHHSPLHSPPHSPRSTRMGALILGASSGFIAAPCTTPVLTTILSYIATQQSVVLGALLMFTFALGLGTILVVIGTFTGAVKILPKSGKWMQTVKLVSGVLILALGQYYVFKAGTVH